MATDSSHAEEPWLRGPLPGVPTALAPLLYSFQQAREDLRRWTKDLTDAQMWERPYGLASVGYQIRHIGASVERLMSYATGRQLTAAQLAELNAEMEAGGSSPELLAALEVKFSAAEVVVRGLDPSRLDEPREVGRKRLPSTLGGLLTHIAEHTQRHVGQAIVTAKVVRGSNI